MGAELRENRGTSAALSAVSTNPFDEDSDEGESAKWEMGAKPEVH